jgi:hypothetical protein
MKPQRFLAVAALCLALLFAGYFALFMYQLGAPVDGEWWVDDVFRYRKLRAENLQSPKIIIAAGSNGLFGINSRVLEQKTGLPVLNLSGHAELDLDYSFFQIRKFMGNEDIVVLPLEFEYYSRDGTITDWFSSNMMAWGPEYLAGLPAREFFKFFTAAQPARVLEGVLAKISADRPKATAVRDMVATLEKLLTSEGTAWRGYSYTSLNRYGEINVDGNPSLTGSMNYGLDAGVRLSDHFLEVYGKIKKFVQEKQGVLILTWPVTMKNPLFDFSDPESLAGLHRLEHQLRAHGITLQCKGAAFNLDRRYFLDTPYHTNRQGALIRSQRLADCLVGRIIVGNGDI